jgi:hypothetical protein
MVELTSTLPYVFMVWFLDTPLLFFRCANRARNTPWTGEYSHSGLSVCTSLQLFQSRTARGDSHSCPQTALTSRATTVTCDTLPARELVNKIVTWNRPFLLKNGTGLQRYLLWHVDPSLGNDCEIISYTVTVARKWLSSDRMGIATDSKATEERCFLCGPCRDILSRKSLEFS